MNEIAPITRRVTKDELVASLALGAMATLKTGELKALKIGGRTLVWLDSVPAPEEPK